MRIATTIIALLMLAGVASAQPKELRFSLTIGTNGAATVSQTNSTVRGWIEDVYIDVPATAGSTGTLSLVYSPSYSTLSDVDIVTEAAIAADSVRRPRFDGTDAAGNALTSDDPWRMVVIGDLIFSCTNSTTTGVVYRALVHIDENE